jgi:hypothetical protein
LVAAGLGLLFIIAAASILLLNQLQDLALITLLGSALSGFVSGTNFYLYNKSSSQMAVFHNRLETTQRFLLADGLCNAIADPDKMDETRCALIRTIGRVNTESEADQKSPVPAQAPKSELNA